MADNPEPDRDESGRQAGGQEAGGQEAGGQEAGGEDGRRRSHDHGTVGSVAEEAAKLLGALQGWAAESRQDLTNSSAGAASAAAAAFQAVNEHVATGAPECRYCPVCQLIVAVRDANPDVKEHLSAAAASMVKAVASLMATPIPDRSRRRDGRDGEGGVEKIDLDDGDGSDEMSGGEGLSAD